CSVPRVCLLRKPRRQARADRCGDLFGETVGGRCPGERDRQEPGLPLEPLPGRPLAAEVLSILRRLPALRRELARQSRRLALRGRELVPPRHVLTAAAGGEVLGEFVGDVAAPAGCRDWDVGARRASPLTLLLRSLTAPRRAVQVPPRRDHLAAHRAVGRCCDRHAPSPEPGDRSCRFCPPGDVLVPEVRRLVTSVASKVRDRKSTRLNSSHVSISYAVF